MQLKSNLNEPFRSDMQPLFESVEKVMFGKTHVTKLILISILCNDHILLEDVPGTGKTMLINTIAKILGLDFKRIQGTPDLLPGDLTGLSIFDQKEGEFRFIAGPVFTNVLLFDEINRTSPKTQSALLEAMAESQVSIDNKTYKLPKPFFVIATQNPIEHAGTYALPQAQLDRFLIKTNIGYPSIEEEKKIMLQEDLKYTDTFRLPIEVLLEWQSEYKKVFIHDQVVNKLLNLIRKTRESGLFTLGISPRSGRKLIKALQAHAFIMGREFVTKDDIFDIFLPVMSHRVFARQKGTEEKILKELLIEEKF